MNLISATKTTAGLEVHAWLDEKDDPKAKEVSEEQLANVKLVQNKFHGEWNYEIHPNTPQMR